jgi:hypothetical protein
MRRTSRVSRRLIAVMGGLLLCAVEAAAHGGAVENIDLSASPDLERAVIQAAQQYLGTTRPPESFDHVNGKVSVNFDRAAAVAVLVDALDYGRSGRVRVFGFKDERRLPKQAATRISRAEATARARTVFEREIPAEMGAQLSPLSLRPLAGTYVATWIRKVGGVPILGNETFEVVVNGVTGEVVGWELGIFDFPSQVIDLGLTIPADAARRRAADAVRARGLPHVLVTAPPMTLVVHGREPYYGMVFATGDSSDRRYVTVHGRGGQVQIGPRNLEFEEVAEAMRPGTTSAFPGPAE